MNSGTGRSRIPWSSTTRQCGVSSVQAPVCGLYHVGCDAGGSGVGTQQAAKSGMKVADLVLRYHRMKNASP